MRTLKFRGLKKFSRDWIYGMPTYDFMYIFDESNVNSPDSYEVDADTIGQFTGLKDKNGVEIYEGDIVKYFNRLGKITWHEYVASFDLTFVKNIEGEPYMAMTGGVSNNQWRWEVEVIGNIHQNKDLLK